MLLFLGFGGLAGAGILAVVGSFVISLWVLPWAICGGLLAAGYVLEFPRALHSDLGFALAWGAFPTLAGYCAQAERLSPEILLVAAAMALLSLAQRALSTDARFVRRTVTSVAVEFEVAGKRRPWTAEQLLGSWELPLQLLAAFIVMLAVSLLALRA